MDKLKLYTDAHIDKQVVIQLRNRGVDIVRCEEVNMKHAEDIEHLKYAVQQGRVLITADRDFIDLHTAWTLEGKTHCGIMYVQPEARALIGVIVKQLYFYHLAVEIGAATLENDIYNKLERIKREG